MVQFQIYLQLFPIVFRTWGYYCYFYYLTLNKQNKFFSIRAFIILYNLDVG